MSGVRASTTSLSGRRSLTSTVEQVLTETPRYVAKRFAYKPDLSELLTDLGFSSQGM